MSVVNFIRKAASRIGFSPGDTALMRAIRKGNRSKAASLLRRPPSEVRFNEKNFSGETALTLALRGRYFDFAEKIVSLAAIDGENGVASGNPPQPFQMEAGAVRSPVDIREFLGNQPNLKDLKFEDLARLRGQLSAFIEQQYPQGNWRAELSPSQKQKVATAVSALNRSGIVELGRVLNSSKIKKIRAYLAQKPIYMGHVVHAGDATPRTLKEIARSRGQGCYSEDVIVNAPHLWDIANDSEILSIIADTFGCTPSIFATNVMWSFPRSPGSLAVAQAAHRDYDDYFFVVLFIYLTDVDANSGPHRYFPGTHNLHSLREILSNRMPRKTAGIMADHLFRSIDGDPYVHAKLINELLGDQMTEIHGPAGTGFLADPFGFHLGLPPRTRPRLVAWIRYGIQMRNSEQFRDQPRLQVPEMTAPCDAYINRLVPEMMARFELHRQRLG